MIAAIFNQIGEWNPQFHREVKGKLKGRNLILMAISSGVIQLFCVSVFADYRASGNWQLEWKNIFQVLNWMLPLFLLVAGVYLLSSDLSREQRRGTLNFLRLSPQSSESILFGKLLGVPILLYLGLALALPLHFWAGIASGISWPVTFGLYPLWAAMGVVFYNTALLLTLLGKEEHHQKPVAAFVSLLALMTAPSCIGAIASSFHWMYPRLFVEDWSWYGLNFGRLPQLGYLWLLGTLAGVSFWIWQAANRRWRNPNLTVWSKSQSYGIVASTQLWFLGFTIPGFVPSRILNAFIGGSWLVVTMLEIFLLILVLSPDRQALLDWTRYRHWQEQGNRLLWRDLLFGEKSPAVAAIALNVGIVAAIWLPWMLLFRLSDDSHSEIFLGFLLTANILLIYAAIAQLIRFHAKTFKHAIVMTIPWIAIVLSPWLLASVLHVPSAQMPLLWMWLFSPLPWVGIFTASTSSLMLGFLAQLGTLGLLLRQLQQQLKQAGISESKKHFTEPLNP